jgi:hypothetical protein
LLRDEAPNGEAIESSGRQVLEQLLQAMLPQFLKQVRYTLPFFYYSSHFLVLPAYLVVQPALLQPEIYIWWHNKIKDVFLFLIKWSICFAI